MSIYNEDNSLNNNSDINVVIDTTGSEFYAFLNLLNQVNANYQAISSATTNIISNSSVYLENPYSNISTNQTLSVNKAYIYANQNVTLTASLPENPSIGDYINIFFEKNNNNLYFNNSKINGMNDSLCVDVSSLFSFVYINSSVGWRIAPYVFW
jgi:hypothetical protein